MKKLNYETGSIVKLVNKDHISIIQAISEDIKSAYAGMQALSSVYTKSTGRLISTIEQMYPGLDEFNIIFNHKNNEIRVLNKKEIE